MAMGWVLLLPPAGGKGSPAPLERWQHVGSFDSAAECEAARVELIEAARRPLGDPWTIPEPGDPVPARPTTSWPDSRCVPGSGPQTEPRPPS
jgi:hypothetical protein